MSNDVTFHQDKNRFELTENGHTAFADIRQSDQKLYIDYVESPLPLRGTGAAGRLMQGIVKYATDQNLEIRPICGYADTWLKRNTK